MYNECVLIRVQCVHTYTCTMRTCLYMYNVYIHIHVQCVHVYTCTLCTCIYVYIGYVLINVLMFEHVNISLIAVDKCIVRYLQRLQL